ncbi:MAG: ATP-grasp domain-containing protein [Lachnospiraceae bacterium]|nr:ATP-grasp domain-containing protein [Lachnospiraceae bacterium]
MNGWIIYNLKDYERNKAFAEMIINQGMKSDLSIRLLFVEKLKFGVKNKKPYIFYDNEEIKKADFAIMRIIYPLLSKHLEICGINVYNNSLVADICNDKAKTYQHLSKTDINVPDSYFVKRDYMDYYINNGLINDDDVIKSVDGHGGSEVSLYNESFEYNKVKDYVIQPLITRSGKDVRIYILDNKILAGVLRTSCNSFKSNYSLGGKIELFNDIDLIKKDVYTVIDYFMQCTKDYKVPGITFAGIDFIIDDNNNFFFNEIEDVVGCRMLYNVSDIKADELLIQTIFAKICKF